MRKSIAVMEGDGNPEIMQSAISVLEATGADIEFRSARAGGAAIDHCGDPMPMISRRITRGSHAVLLGPVGGEKWESDDPRDPKPETAIRTLQKTRDAHAFVQPLVAFEGVSELSSLEPGNTEDINLIIVRAMGGIDTGERRRSEHSASDKYGYKPQEIKDVGRTAFGLAIALIPEIDRQPMVTSVDKANVLEVSRVWRETMDELQSEEYPDVGLDHMLADNAAAELSARPQQFDVIVSDDFFGGILTGVAAGITDPGLVPSAWLNVKGRGIYTPARSEGMANPIPMILSGAMALEYSLGMPEEAKRVKDAVAETINDGILPQDLGGDATNQVFTFEVVRSLGGVRA